MVQEREREEERKEERKGEREVVRGRVKRPGGRRKGKVVEDMTDLVKVRRRNKGRTVEERREENSRKVCRTVQIFVKVDGRNASPLELPLRDNVGDVAKCIPNSACCSKRDVYVTCEERVIRRTGELRSCGVCDGSTVQVVSRMHHRGRHKDRGTERQDR